MFNIFLTKKIHLTLLLAYLCTIVQPSSCYVLPSNGISLSIANTHRFRPRANTPLRSSPDDSAADHDEPTSLDEDGSEISTPELSADAKTPDGTAENTGQINADNFDQFHFDPENFKRIFDSFTLFKGPSYSTTEYNFPLPEGCRTIPDFLRYPRNYDFSRSADIDNIDDRSIDFGSLKDEEPFVPVMEGPYMKSAYDPIGKVVRTPFQRFTTREDDEAPVKPEDMLETLKRTDVKAAIASKTEPKGNYEPFDSFPEHEVEPPKDEVPTTRINPNYFMFDEHGYLQYYLKYLNTYDYRVFSYEQKDDEKLSFYLNNQFVKQMERPFPPERGHTDAVRAYFLGLLPSLMETLVELIKNDPNKSNTPSPPFHDLSLLENFKPPEFTDEDLRLDGQARYERFSSLEGLHEPENNLVYPYFNREPLYQRMLLRTYLDMHTTKDLGEPWTYKKYRSKSKQLKAGAFPSRTRDPKPDSELGAEEAEQPPEPFVEKLTKLYEHGKKKRGKAMVYLEPGNGHIVINNRDGYQYVYYNETRLREILEPLSQLHIYTKFNVVAQTRGGGIAGQSVAIRHALVRYLYRIMAPKLKPILRRLNLVTIDRRKVERKKTSWRKARKKEQYSKR